MTMIWYTMKGEQIHAEFLVQHENGPNFGKNADTCVEHAHSRRVGVCATCSAVE